MKKHLWLRLSCFLLAFTMIFGFTACKDGGEQPVGELDTTKTPTIYLAGDSTVQTYTDAQYIAGWGQYLADFLDGITVVNAAKGGRSSRSFINEGRLFGGNEYKYSFSENGGKSIEEVIKKGDFLFIQFGHNDDDTKSGDTQADRMTPLGTPDASGKYPVTAPTGKQPTTYLPQSYKDSFASSVESKLTEIKKYGDEYYAYDCGGTYKWFLKQYIDFARTKGAIPVLVTPVARVKFSGNQIVGGPGLHGANFAYVEAVRQLATEEDCLLIDLFAESKTLLETATPSYANFLMALKSNSLTGTWPTDYDKTYNNPDLGYEGIEATHYNKYGAYLTAGKLVEHIIAAAADKEYHKKGKEYYSFASHIKTTPAKYVDPSNLMSKTIAAALEGLFTTVTVTNPSRVYPDPARVKAAITELIATAVTAANYETQTAAYEAVLASYNNLNVDDRSAVDNYSALIQYSAALLNAKIEALLTGTVNGENYRTYETICKGLRAEYAALSATLQALVTNIGILEQYEQDVKDNKPRPTETIVLNPDDLSDLSDHTVNDITFKFDSNLVFESKYTATAFEYNGVQYAATSKCVYLNGNGGLTSSSPTKYVEFTTSKQFNITVVAGSSGDPRTILMTDSNKTSVGTFAAVKSPQAITTIENVAAGTYRLASAGSNVCLYYIIIEFFD